MSAAIRDKCDPYWLTKKHVLKDGSVCRSMFWDRVFPFWSGIGPASVGFGAGKGNHIFLLTHLVRVNSFGGLATPSA